MDERRIEAASGAGGEAGSGSTGRSGSWLGAFGGRSGSGAPDLLDAPRRRVLPKFLMGLALIALLVVIGSMRRPKPPELAADCTKPTFALSTESVAQARPVTFTIVGPDSKRYVLGVNTAAYVHRAEGGYDAIPLLGRENDMILPRVEPMKNCRATGVFALPIPVGEHQVTLYELTPDGSIEVERKTIEVTTPTT